MRPYKLLALIPPSLAVVQLPPITGPYGVGRKSLQLTDFHRNDIFTSKPRNLMVTLYYPTATRHEPAVPALSPLLAAVLEQTFGVPNVTLATYLSRSIPDAKPLSFTPKTRIIFSTGSGFSRFLYHSLLEDLASYGNLVIAIDHPSDAILVEFPDLPPVHMIPLPQNASREAVMEFGQKLYDQRVKDILFVEKETAKQSTGGKTVVLGHSLGGAAAAGAIAANPASFAGGIDFDGRFYSNPLVKQPFLIMGTPGQNSTNEPTWRTFLAQKEGWKKELTVSGFTHLTYTDVNFLAEKLGARNQVGKEKADEAVGSVGGDRGVEIVRCYARDFVEWVVGKGKGQLVMKESHSFPEVNFL